MKISGYNRGGRHLPNGNGNGPAEASADENGISSAETGTYADGIGISYAETGISSDAIDVSTDETGISSVGTGISSVETGLAADETGLAAILSDAAIAEAQGMSLDSSVELSSMLEDGDPMAAAIDIPFVDVDEEPSPENEGEGLVAKRKKRILKRTALGLAILLVAIFGVIALDILANTGLFIRAPDVNEDPRPSQVLPPDNQGVPAQPTIMPGGDGPNEGAPGGRNQDKYTFLVLAWDDGEANTDVIMVVSFDTVDKSVNVVNIPRDTVVNVEWAIKKANSILPYMRMKFKGTTDASKKDEEAMKETVGRFADLLGFEVDFWVTVNMKGFAALVDAIGGVDFDVPVNMEYHDTDGKLHISYRKGMHRGLTGKQALEILRFRSYSGADMARINTQQLFLTAAMEQILAKRSSLNVTSLADAFFKNVRTSIPLNNLAWFGLRFLELSSEDIGFDVLPGNTLDSVGGTSYVTIYVDEWLEIVNTQLSPFSREITPSDVSILTRGADKKFYVTDGNWIASPSWGSGSRPPSQSGGGTSGGSSGGSSGGTGSGSGAGDGESDNGEGGAGEDGADPSDVQPADPDDNTQDGGQEPGDAPTDGVPQDGGQPQPDVPSVPPPTPDEPTTPDD